MLDAELENVFEQSLTMSIFFFLLQGRQTLMQVLLDSSSPVQKGIAAYLVLMKDPQPSELQQLFTDLGRQLPLNKRDTQVINFVMSHLNNILTSTEPQTLE